MATNTIVKKQPTMSSILASNAIAELGKSLCLSDTQLMKARSSALTLSGDSKLSKCDPYSLVKYCFEIARYNFTRDDCAYPVPYNNKVQAQIGYKGFRELAMASGKYNEITCVEVYECDKVFRNRETGKIEVDFNEDYKATLNSKIVGFFAYAKTKEGKLSNTLFWTIEECEKHGKHYSKTYNSVWGDKEFGFNKMAKKTVIKQLCQELDQTPLLQEAIKNDQIVYGGNGEKDSYLDNPTNKDVIEAEVEESRKTTVNNSIIEDDEEELPTNLINDLGVVESQTPSPEPISLVDDTLGL